MHADHAAKHAQQVGAKIRLSCFEFQYGDKNAAIAMVNGALASLGSGPIEEERRVMAQQLLAHYNGAR
jgi:hypothetical protein